MTVLAAAVTAYLLVTGVPNTAHARPGDDLPMPAIEYTGRPEPPSIPAIETAWTVFIHVVLILFPALVIAAKFRSRSHRLTAAEWKETGMEEDAGVPFPLFPEDEEDMNGDIPLELRHGGLRAPGNGVSRGGTASGETAPDNDYERALRLKKQRQVKRAEIEAALDTLDKRRL